MRIGDLDLPAQVLSGPSRAELCAVDAATWRAVADAVADADGSLVALWAADERDRHGGFLVHAAYDLCGPMLCAVLELDAAAPAPAYPDLAYRFPAAGRMQRAAFDLLGVKPLGAADERPWLRHAGWAPGVHPLRRDVPPGDRLAQADDSYAFVSVAGEGVHEIPVGPVHAGTIEPGHFRFSIIGERVLRLEERLGYKHKGVEKAFEGLDVAQGARLAGRVSGDSTVAYAWAYAMAVESVAGVDISPRAAWLRAYALERERVGNHLGDLGFIGNDAGLGFALAQFSRLREDWLRVDQAVFGHRLVMDFIVPGGVASDFDEAFERELRHQARAIEHEVTRLRALFADHEGLQDRLRRCGVVTPELARRLGLTGLAGRASGVARDLRLDAPVMPYDRIAPRLATRTDGDVAARVAVRFDEILESLQVLQRLLDTLPPPEPLRVSLPEAATGFGIGRVEGWRGEVLVAVELEAGRVRRAHPHDPSWQNWPVLEHAILGNIVPDFPLINKSFNLSYAGVDL